MKQNFNSLPLRPELLESLKSLKFHSMTPIQTVSLPLIFSRVDVIAQAKTGSGKTAAFALGILNQLDSNLLAPQGLVLCPTRELAEQVANEFRRLSRKISNIKITTLCGGIPEMKQAKSLETGIHIIVGTPGRTLKHLQKKSLPVQDLKVAVLDEADKMLDMGFHQDIIAIFKHFPKERQTLLFSATFPKSIKELSSSIQNNAEKVKIDSRHSEDQITQIFLKIEDGIDKNQLLYRTLAHYQLERALVFCETKKETEEVSKFLSRRGVSSQFINGDLEQNNRHKVMTQFSNQSLSILVATDVASRGLDISNLTAVINFHLPSQPEGYTHRIGRTGRAGEQGFALSFVDSSDHHKFEELKPLLPKNIKILRPTDLKEKQPYQVIPPMKTIYISGGKKDKLRAGDILGALIRSANLTHRDVGEITIFPHYSYIAIRSEKIESTLKNLDGKKIKKRKYKVGPL